METADGFSETRSSSVEWSKDGRLGMMLVAKDAGEGDGATTLQAVGADEAATHLTVTSEDSTVLKRTTTRDFVIEVASNTPRCGYNIYCRGVQTRLSDAKLTNTHATESRVARLTFSRNFETRCAKLSNAPCVQSQTVHGQDMVGTSCVSTFEVCAHCVCLSIVRGRVVSA
jgi:hypothetical protein